MKNIISQLKERRTFIRLIRYYNLPIDYQINRESISIFNSIFRGREYAPFFPFHENASIVDIGAHFGYFSLFAALHTGDLAKIIAVEPDPKNYSILLKNLSDSASTKVTALNLALAAESGKRGWATNARSYNSSLYDKASQSPPPQTVPTLSLAEMLSRVKLSKVDFLKMDCEGAEYEILLNLPSETLSRIDTISLEFHQSEKPGYTANALAKKLSSEGFQIKQLTYTPSFTKNYGKLIASRLF